VPSALKQMAKMAQVEVKVQKIIYKMMDEIVGSVNELMPSREVTCPNFATLTVW
jgi:hypothetical protein